MSKDDGSGIGRPRKVDSVRLISKSTSSLLTVEAAAFELSGELVLGSAVSAGLGSKPRSKSRSGAVATVPSSEAPALAASGRSKSRPTTVASASVAESGVPVSAARSKSRALESITGSGSLCVSSSSALTSPEAADGLSSPRPRSKSRLVASAAAVDTDAGAGSPAVLALASSAICDNSPGKVTVFFIACGETSTVASGSNGASAAGAEALPNKGLAGSSLRPIAAAFSQSAPTPPVSPYKSVASVSNCFRSFRFE